MLTFIEPKPVKLFFGLIYSDEKVYQSIREELISIYGEIDIESDILSFAHTSYYGKEMGTGLCRRFVSFKELIDAHSDILDAKHFAVKIENDTATDQRRTINIDPGYINESRLILSTTKDFSHRIYIGKGVFLETTMLLKKNSFEYLPWTYPDYKLESYKKFFLNMKTIYKEQIKSL